MKKKDGDKFMKRKMVVIPNSYNYIDIGDIINYINYYKSLMEVYLLVNGFDNIKEVDGYTIVSPKTSFGKYLMLTSDYVIDAGGIEPGYKLSHNQFWISVCQSIPNKKMFVDSNVSEIFKTIKYGSAFDCIISSSPYYTNNFLRNLIKYKGDIKELGSSRMDTLINFDNNRIIEIKNKCGIPLDKKVILYAPSYRKKGKITIPFSTKKLLDLLGDDYVIVTKFHNLNILENTDGFIDCTNYPEIIDLMHISEFLISDYSSLVIDYAILNKPIFLFQFDKRKYYLENEAYFDFDEYLPNDNIVENEDDLINVINKNKDKKVDYSLIVNKFYPYEDGKSTERIIKNLNLNCNSRKSNDLIFLINDLNEIGGIHTFVKNMAQYYKQKYDTKIFVIAINEFTDVNNNSYIFESEYIDYFLSSNVDKINCRIILENTSANIISMQFSAQIHFQRYLNNKNVILMYHGDANELIIKERATNYLDYLNLKTVCNYKKLLLLSNENVIKLLPHLNEEIRPRLSYMNNSIGLSFKKIKSSNKASWAFIGRLDDGKNPFALIEIGKIIKKNNLKIKINIYGDGALKNDVESKIIEFGLKDIINLHGFESNKEKIFKENIGLIMTSKFEGYPYVILEAYAYGKPVILFNTFTAAQELVDHNKTGFLIENENYQDVIEKMALALHLDDNDIKNKYLTFNNDVIFKKWDNLFNEINAINSITNNKVVKASDNSFKKIINKLKKIINESKFLKFIKKVQRKIKNKFPNFSEKLTYYFFEKRNNKKIRKLNINNTISIIIPYYNNYNTISFAIDSVLNQKYKHYEIIVVDYGSQNKCDDIISAYNNARIKYYKIENEELCSAKNFGIEKATHEYIMFLDANDTLYKSSIKSLLIFAIENDVDVVSGIVEKRYVQTNFKELYRAEFHKKNRVINIQMNLNIYFDFLLTNKLYKRKLLLENKLFFKNGLFEDRVYTAMLYSKIKKMGNINEKVLTMNIYDNNTANLTLKTIDNYLATIKMIDEIWNESSEKTRFMLITIFFSYDLAICLNEYLHLSDFDRNEVFNKARYVFEKYRSYTYPKLIKNYLYKHLISLIVENDSKSFSEIATLISKSYIENEKNDIKK